MGIFDGQSEHPTGNELPKTTKLEQLIRQDQTLQRVFVDGIRHHLELLNSNTQDAFGQEVDTTEPTNQFKVITEAFNSGFSGYVVRIISTDNAGVAYLSFAKTEDIYSKDASKLNTSPGKKPQEVIVSLGKYALTPDETNDPSIVFSNKGTQIAAFTQETWYDPNMGKVRFQRGSGFSIRMPEKGGCMGTGTKWSGILEYQSDLITKMDNIPTATLKQQLESSLKPTPPVAFNSSFR